MGYGHTGPDVHPGMAITQAQADALLCRDLETAEDGVRKAVGLAHTDENQFAAMVSLAFNIGVEGFIRSSVLRYHKTGESGRAADSFIKWDNVTVKGVLTHSKGLARRRLAEKALYLEQIA